MQEAIDDWMINYDAKGEAFRDGKCGEFKEAEFVFVYDLASLLNYYAEPFTFEGLSDHWCAWGAAFSICKRIGSRIIRYPGQKLSAH